MVFFRGTMNQQRSTPRRNKMPMRTNSNFGGGFALNPSLRNLSTVMQPRSTNQVSQYGRPIYNKDGESYSEKTITEPINGKFYNIPTVGANGNILSKEQAIQSVIGQDGKIIDPITGTPLQGYADLNNAVGAAKNRSQSINISPANNMGLAQGMIGNIIPEQDGAALAKQQLGEPTMITQNIDGQRVLSDDEQATIDNAALQERLKNRYDAPNYTKGQKIAAIAGVLGDVFSAPGDRNKTATIMQTIEAQRAGDMKRQQARLADEQNTALVDGLIVSGQVKPEMRELFIARPDLIGELGLQKVVEGGEGFQLEKQSIIAGIKKTEATISDMITNSLRKDAEFQQGILENDQDYDIRLRTIANQEARTAIENAGLDETIRKNKASEQKDRNKKPEINFKDEQSLRKEYASQTKEFPKVRDAYLRIQASSDGTAASDLSLIFNYMKVLDPGSTVREGEFANAQNAAGVGTRIGNLYNQMIKGTRLSDEQRKEFLSTARNLYGEQEKTYQNTVTSYRELATAYGLDPERSVPLSRVVKDANFGDFSQEQDDQPNVFGD